VIRAALALACAVVAAANASAAPECAPPSSSVRVMLHDPEVLAGRLRLLANAEGREPRVAALRTLFTAAGCTQISELGDGRGRNVECTTPGTGEGVIVVGTSQEFDSLGTLALLPSLAEALAAAPRKHTIRWVAFSAHVVTKDGIREPRPKGAMRLVNSFTADERARLDAMIHLGPLGFGPLREHPDGVEATLRCALEAGARSAGMEIGARRSRDADCRVKRDAGPGSRLPALQRSAGYAMIDCSEADRWLGGHDWHPFRRAKVPIFGIHSGDSGRASSALDTDLYLRSYRAIAIFLALSDDALSER
jgi:hypothetical protein